MRIIGWLFVAIVVLYALSKFGRDGSPSGSDLSSSASSICAESGTALAGYLSKATSLGFIRVRSGRYQVDEAPWAVLEHDQKINLALAAFCDQVGERGRGVTILYGLHDGAKKASVVDGSYFD